MRKSFILLAGIIAGFVVVLYAIKPFDQSDPLISESENTVKVAPPQNTMANPQPVTIDNEIIRDTAPVGENNNGPLIKLKHREIKITPVDEPERLLDIYDGLANSALEGDGKSLTILLDQLIACKRSWRDPKELEQALLRISTSKQVQLFPGAGIASISNDQMANAIAETLKHHHNYCRGLSDEQIDLHKELAQLGSDLGYLYATNVALEIANSEADKFKQELRLWQNIGHVDGVAALSDRFFNGVFEENDTNKPEPDFRQSFAYFKIEELLHLANKEQDSHDSHNHSIGIYSEKSNYLNHQYLEQKRARYAGLLSPQEELDAEQLAIKLIGDNQNCCAAF